MYDQHACCGRPPTLQAHTHLALVLKSSLARTSLSSQELRDHNRTSPHATGTSGWLDVRVCHRVHLDTQMHSGCVQTAGMQSLPSHVQVSQMQVRTLREWMLPPAISQPNKPTPTFLELMNMFVSCWVRLTCGPAIEHIQCQKDQNASQCSDFCKTSVHVAVAPHPRFPPHSRRSLLGQLFKGPPTLG